MATAPEIAAAFQRQQVDLAASIAREAGALWTGMDPAYLDRSWLGIQPRLTALQGGGLALAAGAADGYLTDVLTAQGLDPVADATVNAPAFAYSASDGRPLETLLYQPVIQAKAAIGGGATTAQAMNVGRLALDLIVRTQIADAGRIGVSVATAARRRVGGYVRMVSSSACSRCIVLAGRWYRWNQGFARHPRCHCTNIPVAEDRADDVRTDPKLYFNSLSAAEQDRVFTAAGAQAIRDGADISQVVNARRGMYSAGGVDYTRESTTKRGVARGQARLMPEAIYKLAHGNREEALRLLRQYRYIL